MTARLAPSSKGTTLGSHIKFNTKKFRPSERVLFTPTDAGALTVGTIAAYTDMSGNWFTIDPEDGTAAVVVFVTNIRGRVPAAVDGLKLLIELASIPIPAPGPGAYEAAKASMEAVLRRNGIE